MLGAADFGKVRGSFEQVIGLLGVPATLTPAKPPATAITATIGMRTAGPNDEWIINSFGINAVIFTLAAKDFAAPPQRFDRVTIRGVTYTADAVHPVNLNGSLVGWKLYCKGNSA